MCNTKNPKKSHLCSKCYELLPHRGTAQRIIVEDTPQVTLFTWTVLLILLTGAMLIAGIKFRLFIPIGVCSFIIGSGIILILRYHRKKKLHQKTRNLVTPNPNTTVTVETGAGAVSFRLVPKKDSQPQVDKETDPVLFWKHAAMTLGAVGIFVGAFFFPTHNLLLGLIHAIMAALTVRQAAHIIIRKGSFARPTAVTLTIILLAIWSIAFSISFRRQ